MGDAFKMQLMMGESSLNLNEAMQASLLTPLNLRRQVSDSEVAR